MTADSDLELYETRKAAGELFLANHLEKHGMEQEAVKTALDVQRKDTDDYRSAHDATHKAEQESVRTALDAEKQRDEDHRIAHSAAHDAHAVLHKVEAQAHKEQHAAEHTAVGVAQASMDKRLDAMNEFRDQLRDQAATFISRSQYDAFVQHYEKAHDEVLQQVATEREERRANEGSHRGSAASIGWIVTAISVVGAILGIIIVISNVLTSVPLK